MEINERSKMYTVGTKVKVKATGRIGTVVEVTDREVVVDFSATGETMRSPWGDYKDAGQEGHYFLNHASRIIEPLTEEV
jgi:hypothetical protein